MKIRTILFPVLVLFLFNGIRGCEEQASGPQIEWLSGYTTTYSYSGGVLSGANFILTFNVVDDQSGELSIDASIGSTEKSCSAFVEAGEQYKVVASVGIGKEGSQSTLILDPSSDSEPCTLKITDYSVNLKGVEIR